MVKIHIVVGAVAVVLPVVLVDICGVTFNLWSMLATLVAIKTA